MKVLVIGATGGSGAAAIDELLAQGHEVTAFARKRVTHPSPRLRAFEGDAMNGADLERAVAGHDAVVVTLGISENALLVRLRGSRSTPLDVRSAGTANVIAAMREHGVRKLVVQTSYGVGETRDRLPLKWRLIFWLLLKPQIADTEVQEQLVRESGLDWVIVQPVGLTDATDDGAPFASIHGETCTMAVSRKAVGHFLAEAATSPDYVHRAVALSSRPAARRALSSATA